MTSLYNEKLISYQMEQLGISPDLLAQQANVSRFSVDMALIGRLGTLSRLKRITDRLFINWEYITRNLPENQFHRAVLTNGDRRERTVKSRPVYGSANRPRK